MSFEPVYKSAKDRPEDTHAQPAAPAEPPVWDLLKGDAGADGTAARDYLVTNGGKRVPLDFLKGKTVGLYFSAHWCPPCRGFTPVAAAVYHALRAANKDFEVVFVSSDRNEHQFREYFAEMPWLAVPWTDKRTKGALSSRFGVSGIPCLILFDAQGQFVTDNGREALGTAGAAGYPYTQFRGQRGTGAGGSVGLQRLVLLVFVIWFVWNWLNKEK